jgi:hypothetical protein
MSISRLMQMAAAGAGGEYQISRSLRFNSADSAYLSRTPASAGDRKTWTWSGWVKRSQTGANNFIFIYRDLMLLTMDLCLQILAQIQSELVSEVGGANSMEITTQYFVILQVGIMYLLF